MTQSKNSNREKTNARAKKTLNRSFQLRGTGNNSLWVHQFKLPFKTLQMVIWSTVLIKKSIRAAFKDYRKLATFFNGCHATTWTFSPNDLKKKKERKKIGIVTHRWSIQVPLPKLILPVPKPLSGVDEGWLKQRVNGGESSDFVRATGHRVKMHQWAAATKDRRMGTHSFIQLQSFLKDRNQLC